jgi:N-acetylglutamate synthase-like GNAT family acetyltransferase
LKTQFGKFEISDDKDSLQLDLIHAILKETYWSKGVPKEVVRKAILGSMCFGVYENKRQVGYARLVTDKATFAWLCDVIIDEKCRGQGLSKALMEFILSHPDLKGLRRICLATKDAHELYRKFGFKVTEAPQNWMEIKDNDIYLKMNASNSIA